MPSKHIETKHKLSNIKTVRDFNALMDAVILTDDQKRMLHLIYIEHKTLDYIADELNISLQTVKSWHRKALTKIADMI